jgi:hypothetical protein
MEVKRRESAASGLSWTPSESRKQLLEQKMALLRKPLFRDATRKVDIFWQLEDPRQMDIVKEHLQSLQSLDPDNVGTLNSLKQRILTVVLETPHRVVRLSIT